LQIFGCTLVQLICILLVVERRLYADTLTLTNGDKLTCEIEKLEKGKLTVKVPYADDTELTFDWKMVSAMTSETNLKMHLDDGTELIAKLQPAKQAGQLMPQGSAAPLALKRVVSFETEEGEGSWTDNLSSDTDFDWGYTGTDGLHTVSLDTENFYWGDKWEAALVGSENTNRYSRQAFFFNQIQGQSNVNRYLTQRFFVFPWALGAHVTNNPGGHGSIWELGGGGGWSFIKKKGHHLQVMGGMVAMNQKATVVITAAGGQQHSASLSEQSPGFLMATRWQKTSEEGMTWLVQGLYVHPTKTALRSQLGLQVNFSIPLAGPVSADMNVQDYTSPLTAGLLSLRGFSVSTGLGLHF